MSLGPICVVRGGGDLATGVVWRLHHAGCSVLVCELAEPLTVRRTVALSSAVFDGVVEVGGLTAQRIGSGSEAGSCWSRARVPVLVAPELGSLVADLGAGVVVDARLKKQALDTRRTHADLVVGLGPGFVAGPGGNCHAVVETQRGHDLGRVLWTGTAAPDTGTPGEVAGHGAERVLRAPVAGRADWEVAIGDVVAKGRRLGSVGSQAVFAPFDGLVRGLVRPGLEVRAGTKIGDVDPRLDVDVDTISDKALAVGGGVLEAVMAVGSGRVLLR